MSYKLQVLCHAKNHSGCCTLWIEEISRHGTQKRMLPSDGNSPADSELMMFKLNKFGNVQASCPHMPNDQLQWITPGKINLRIHPWKRRNIFQTIIFRFYVNLGGCTNKIYQVEMSMQKEGKPSSHFSYCRCESVFPPWKWRLLNCDNGAMRTVLTFNFLGI